MILIKRIITFRKKDIFCFCAQNPISPFDCFNVRPYHKVSVQGNVALGGNFATLCRELDFFEAFFLIINFQKRKGNTFALSIILIAKSLQIDLHSTNLTPITIMCNHPKVLQLLGD